MSKIKSWILTLILPIVGLFYPEFADLEALSLTLASLSGIVGLVVIAVNGLKVLLKYNPETSWKHLPKILSVLVAVIICVLAWWFDFGMFAEQVVVWWQAVATGLIAAGAAMLWYDITFGEMLLKLIGLLKTRNANTE